ncbi:MAG: hypothetical protein CL933_19890 [Deltaproteobacteria bacterium]|nr:hypothetical protein [Deltaproteobacteria bacterium]
MFKLGMRMMFLGSLTILIAACSGGAGEDGPESESSDWVPLPTGEEKPQEKRADLIDKEGFPPVLPLAEEVPAKVEDHAGLIVKVLAEGEGESALQYGEIGEFHYIGSLASGKIFHNTRDGEGKPELIRVRAPGCAKGLALALAGMKPGAKRRVTVPAELGFGKEGDYTKNIPPDALLVYEIELVKTFADLRIGTMKEGAGEVFDYGQTGKFHYTGVLAKDGSVFDSSRDKEPATFALVRGGLIEGWTLSIPGMKVGEQRHIKIPSSLAYGEYGQGGKIGPNEDLIFEVELVEIVKTDN